MTGKWVIRVHVQQGIFFALRRLGQNCFTNSVPQGFLKMVDDRGQMFRGPVPFDPNRRTIFVWLSIDHRLTDTNRYQLTNFID